VSYPKLNITVAHYVVEAIESLLPPLKMDERCNNSDTMCYLVII